MTIPQEIKDKIEGVRKLCAHENGYPTYEDYYSWISRHGQYPAVVAQLIESFTEEVVYTAMSAELEAANKRIAELEAELKQFNNPNNIDY